MINVLKYSTMYLQYSNIEHISEYCTNIDLPSNIAYKPGKVKDKWELGLLFHVSVSTSGSMSTRFKCPLYHFFLTLFMDLDLWILIQMTEIAQRFSTWFLSRYTCRYANPDQDTEIWNSDLNVCIFCTLAIAGIYNTCKNFTCNVISNNKHLREHCTP